MIDDNDDDNGWDTIDTKNPASPSQIEPEIELEETEVDIQEEQPEELKGINTKGAEKRIRKLVAQRKERDEQLALAIEKIKYLETALSDKDKNISDYRRQSVDSKKEEIKRRVEAAQMSFSRAFDDGDKDNLVKAQSDLAEAQAELKMLEYADIMGNRNTHKAPVQNTVERPAVTQYDEGAVEWAKKNEWFGKDKIGTSIALAVDQSLKDEGFDPRDDEFYEELDRRLSKELPSRLRPGGDAKPTQVVAGQSRRQAPSNKVRLTQEDVSLAKKWGIPLERYAAEKKKAERSAGDYTNIG